MNNIQTVKIFQCIQQLVKEMSYLIQREEFPRCSFVQTNQTPTTCVLKNDVALQVKEQSLSTSVWIHLPIVFICPMFYHPNAVFVVQTAQGCNFTLDTFFTSRDLFEVLLFDDFYCTQGRSACVQRLHHLAVGPLFLSRLVGGRITSSEEIPQQVVGDRLTRLARELGVVLCCHARGAGALVALAVWHPLWPLHC